MSFNESGLQDFEGEHVDWIELYNPSSESIFLDAYTLSDDPLDAEKWALPELELTAYSFLLIFASGKDGEYTNGQNNEWHTNFSLKSEGETLALYQDGKEIDNLIFQKLLPNQSFGKVHEDSLASVKFKLPSPRSANSNGVIFNNNRLVINEFLSKNDNGISDSFGERTDWIELFNNSDEYINLKDFSLSDDILQKNKFLLPEILIAPYDFLLIYTSGNDGVFDESIHTNFGISSAGEKLMLVDSEGFFLDFIKEESLSADESFGRITDGNETFVKFLEPTPNASNETGQAKYQLDFSHKGGHYLEPFELDILTEEGLNIYYTTDGSLPGVNSNLFSKPILLDDRKDDPLVFSLIQCTPEPYEPIGEVQKANVIRAAAFIDGQQVSKIYSKTYLVDSDPERYKLPIISLISDADNLFGADNGIYNHYWNSGRFWDRPAHIEYFDEEGEQQIKQDCAIRLHGGVSRAGRQKSFKVYARSEYGESHFNYKFFEDKENDKFKRLVIRNPREELNKTFINDELACRSIAGTDMLIQGDRQTVVFLNGEFWGIYHLREKIDDHFISENLGADKDSITMIKNDPFTVSQDGCEYGDCESFSDLWGLFENKESISDADYAVIAEQMDVDNYISYLITEFYVGNTDWPSNNVRFLKTAPNAKWQWIFFDADFSFRFTSNDIFTVFLDGNVEDWHRRIGLLLLTNEQFKNQLIETFELHLNTIFEKNAMYAHIDALEEKMDHHMPEHLDRFALETTYEVWKERMEVLREFVSFRPCKIADLIEERFQAAISIDSCYVGDLPDYYDCAGMLDGTNYLDECGVCDDDSSNDNTTCLDCADIPNGENYLDECGVCDDDESNDNETCLDCAGIPNGKNYLDNCDVCDDDESNDNETCVDCAGFYSGENYLDECGVCDVNAENDNETCVDCAGIPNGESYLDNCDVCDDDPNNNCTALLDNVVSNFIVQLYPNPTNAYLTISFNEGLEGAILYNVFNVLGKQVLSKSTYVSTNQQAQQLDVSELIDGHYYMEISNENGLRTVEKFVKF